jgi:hypothetical protein
VYCNSSTCHLARCEWKALMAFTSGNPIPPDNLSSPRDAIRLVATLGGVLARNSDGEPGTQSLWLGLQRLDDIVAMWRLMHHATQPTVFSRMDYG